MTPPSMDHRAAADAYRHSSIENAPPIKIVRMLYEGALRFIARAEAEDAGDPRSEFLRFVGRADAIVTELRLALDHSVGGEISANLEALYLFCEDEFARAGLERSSEPLAGVKRVLEVLLDAWQRVEVESTQAA